MKQRIFLGSLGLFLLLVTAACQVPMDQKGVETGTLLLSMEAKGRTLVPDWQNDIWFTRVTLSKPGSTDKEATIYGLNGTFTVTDLAAGSWTLNATAYNNYADPVGTGVLANFPVAAGVTVNCSIPITPLQTEAGLGAYSLYIEFPEDAGIDFVGAQLYQNSNWTPFGASVNMVQFYQYDGNQHAILQQSGIKSGAYTLQLTFRRGGALGAVVGVYGEAVNVYDNEVSSALLGPSAERLGTKTFTLQDFSSSNANLSNVSVVLDPLQTLLTTPGFSSSVQDYTVFCGNSPLSLTPVQSVAGQKIEYQFSGAGTWTASRTGLPIAVMASPGTAVRVRVTAPDQTTTRVYTWTFQPRLSLTFSGNGSTGGLPPPGTNRYLQGETAIVPGNTGFLSQDGKVWAGYWNTEADGTGTTYAAGDSIVVTKSLTLHALWVSAHKVIYHENGVDVTGTVPVESEGHSSGSQAAVLGTTGVAPLSRPGYQFAGWNTAPDGLGTTYAWGTPDNQILMASADVDLWALWIPPECVIEPSGGSSNNLGLTDWLPSPSGTVVVPHGVNSLGFGFLRFKSAVTGISIPSTVTWIESGVLENSGLTSLTIPETVTHIGWSAFSKTQLTSLHIPARTYFDGGAFRDCQHLTTLTLDPAHPSMELLEGSLVVRGAGGKKTLILAPGGLSSPYSVPAGVTSIGWNSLDSTHFTSVVFPESVTEIQGQAFFGSHLTGTLTLPSSLTSVSARSFLASGNLKAFAIDPAAAAYSTLDGVLFNKDRTTLVAVPGGYREASDTSYPYTTRYTVPEGVTTVAREAFENCYYVTAITVASTVTKIEYSCFGNVGPYFKEVTLLSPIPPVLEGENYDSSITKIHVPSEEAKALYLAAPGWSAIAPSVFVVP